MNKGLDKVMDKSYVIISPCRNEQDYMRKTLDSVVNQTIKPSLWVIVDDGSTDDTANILKEYQEKHDFITIVTRENRGHRSVGPGVIDTFYAGYNTINVDDYAYICKLDLDLELPLPYFEILINEMEKVPRLGTYSGKPYFYPENSKVLIPEVCGDESSVGMTKLYKTACFKEIGGFFRQVMWDGIDSHRCRALGWISRSDDLEAIRFVHLRAMGSSQKSIITGRIRHGYGQYFMGTNFFYLIASVIYRLNKKPYVIGALSTFWGYIKSALTGQERLKDPVMQKLMNRFQWHALFVGKNKAVDKINNDQAKVFGTKPVTYTIPNKD